METPRSKKFLFLSTLSSRVVSAVDDRPSPGAVSVSGSLEKSEHVGVNGAAGVINQPLPYDSGRPSPRTTSTSLSCAFLGHADMRNGDRPAMGEGAQQMPVHHGLPDSCGLSAGAEPAGHPQ